MEEAISREKALSEVLRIISASQGDLDAVMQEILAYALDLCDAEFGVMFEHGQNRKFHATFALGIPPVFKSWFDEQGWFNSDGISDDIITALSRSPWLLIIARNTIFTCKGSSVLVS